MEPNQVIGSVEQVELDTDTAITNLDSIMSQAGLPTSSESENIPEALQTSGDILPGSGMVVNPYGQPLQAGVQVQVEQAQSFLDRGHQFLLNNDPLNPVRYGFGEFWRNTADLAQSVGVDISRVVASQFLGLEDTEEAIPSPPENVNIFEHYGLATPPKDLFGQIVSEMAPAIAMTAAGSGVIAATKTAQTLGLIAKQTPGVLGKAMKAMDLAAKFEAANLTNAAYWAVGGDRDTTLSTTIQELEDDPGVVGKFVRFYNQVDPTAKWLSIEGGESELEKAFKVFVEEHGVGVGMGALLPAIGATVSAAKQALSKSPSATQWFTGGKFQELINRVTQSTGELDKNITNQEALDALFSGRSLEDSRASVWDEIRKVWGTGADIPEEVASSPTNMEKAFLAMGTKRADKVMKEDAFKTAFDAAIESGDLDGALRIMRNITDYLPSPAKEPLLGPSHVVTLGKELSTNLLNAAKVLTRTGDVRAEKIQNMLADILGGGLDDYSAVNRMLAKANVDVRDADTLHLTAQLVQQAAIIPRIEAWYSRALSLAAKYGEDSIEAVTARKQAEHLTNMGAQISEGITQLRSGAGVLLQGAQMDERALLEKVLLGGSKSGLSGEFAGYAAHLMASPPKLSSAMMHNTLMQLSKINSAAKAAMIRSSWNLSQNPILASALAAGKIADQTVASLLINGMLSATSTVANVMGASVVSNLVMAGRTAFGAQWLRGRGVWKIDRPIFDWIKSVDVHSMVHGDTVNDLALESVAYGQISRLTHTAEAWLVGLKSMVHSQTKRAWQIGGGSIYDVGNPFGSSNLEAVLGAKAYKQLSNWGGGIGERALNLFGKGVGYSSHVLGSFDVMLKYASMVGEVDANLFQIAKGVRGLRGHQIDQFVREHRASLLDDFTLASLEGAKASPLLTNRLGLKVPDLLAMGEKADHFASLAGMRAGKFAPGSGVTDTKILGPKTPESSIESTGIFRTAKLIHNLPMTLFGNSRTPQAVMTPFTRVAANLGYQTFTPVQGAAEIFGGLASRLGRGQGPDSYLASKYVAEILRGSHGVQAQADLVGAVYMGGALGLAGAVTGLAGYVTGTGGIGPVGREAEAQARERGESKFGDIHMGPVVVSAPALQPFSNHFKLGHDLTFLVLKTLHNGANDATISHVGDIMQESVLASNMTQGLLETTSAITGGEDTASAIQRVLNTISVSAAKAVSRPLTVLTSTLGMDRESGEKLVTLRNQTVEEAFRTSLVPWPWDEKTRYQIQAYDMFGEPVRDVYLPKDSQQFLEANTRLSFRLRDKSPFGQMLSDMESEGLAFPRVERKVTLVPEVGVGNQTSVDIDTQIFFNEKTKKHLWDVYNQYIRDFRDINRISDNYPSYQNNNPADLKPYKLNEIINMISETYVENIHGSKRTFYMGKHRDQLSIGAGKVQSTLEAARRAASERLRFHMAEHGNDYKWVDHRTGKVWTLKEYVAEMDKVNMEEKNQQLYGIEEVMDPTQEIMTTGTEEVSN